jgi:hypothetical protein
MYRPVTDVSESTANTLEVVVLLVVSTTTGASSVHAYFLSTGDQYINMNIFVLSYRTNFDKYHPGYFGKVGMRRFHLTRNLQWRPIINVDKLWSLVPAEEKKGLRENSQVVPVIDILRHGYAKVLGNGQ